MNKIHDFRAQAQRHLAKSNHQKISLAAASKWPALKTPATPFLWLYFRIRWQLLGLYGLITIITFKSLPNLLRRPTTLANLLMLLIPALLLGLSIIYYSEVIVYENTDDLYRPGTKANDHFRYGQSLYLLISGLAIGLFMKLNHLAQPIYWLALGLIFITIGYLLTWPLNRWLKPKSIMIKQFTPRLPQNNLQNQLAADEQRYQQQIKRRHPNFALVAETDHYPTIYQLASLYDPTTRAKILNLFDLWCVVETKLTDASLATGTCYQYLVRKKVTELDLNRTMINLDVTGDNADLLEQLTLLLDSLINLGKFTLTPTFLNGVRANLSTTIMIDTIADLNVVLADATKTKHFLTPQSHELSQQKADLIANLTACQKVTTHWLRENQSLQHKQKKTADQTVDLNAELDMLRALHQTDR